MTAAWAAAALHASGVWGLDLRVSGVPAEVEAAAPFEVRLVVEGVADEAEVRWPEWAEALPGWRVVREDAAEGNRAVALTLARDLPGEAELPAVTAEVVGGAAGGEFDAATSEPVAVRVTSVLDEAEAAPGALLRPREVVGEVEVGAVAESWRGWWGVAVVAVAGAGLLEIAHGVGVR